MIVLDACAIVDVVLDQASSSWVLDQLAGQEICAPAHQPAEVVSALARLVRAGDLDVVTATAAADEFSALEQELVVPTRDHLRRSLHAQERVRVLDGLYIALAEDRRCALVTTNRRLGRSGADADIRTPPPAS